MTNLVQSLFRIDPTEGLVQYVNAIKPYHSKVLDVLVEYVFREDIKATVRDRWSWTMSLTNPGYVMRNVGDSNQTINAVTGVVRTCGYGLVWDQFKTAENTLSTSIISAQSKISLPVVILQNADATIASAYSPDGYVLTTGDHVTCSTSGTLPTTNPQIQVGTTYNIIGTNSAFQLIDPVTSTPVTFISAGTGVLSIEPKGVKFNSFLAEPSVGSTYVVALTNADSNQFTFVDSYAIASVSKSTSEWVVASDIRPTIPVIGVAFDVISLSNMVGNCAFKFSGNQEYYFQPGTSFSITGSASNDGTYTVAGPDSGRKLTWYDGMNTTVPVTQQIPTTAADGTTTVALSQVVPVGSVVYVNNNTGVGGNGRYTVSNATIVGGNTHIVVSEGISLLANGDGTLLIPVIPSRLPWWVQGTEVQVSSTATLPSPLTTTGRYHFIPTSTPGVFNLSTQRYPTKFNDYINVALNGTGTLSIHRSETFYPGAYVRVTGSYLNRNDGNYIISSTSPEGSNVRINVKDRVANMTPSTLATDGVISLNFDSYDAPTYCPVSQSPDLYADTYIRETILFEFSMSLADSIVSQVGDQYLNGFNTSEFGTIDTSPYVLSNPYAMTSSYVILPHGIDTQLFDVGGFVETAESLRQNYSKVV